MEINEEMLASVKKIDEIQKSIENFATNEKVEALGNEFKKFAVEQKNAQRSQAKVKLFGDMATYSKVAAVVCDGLVKAGKIEAGRQTEWLTKANAVINSTDSGQGPSLKPTILDSEISKLVQEYGVVRRNARLRFNVQGSVTLNKRASRITVAGKTRPDGATDLGGSTYTPQTLSTYEVAAITTVEEKLIWDSPVALVMEAIDDLAEALANFEDDMAFNGLASDGASDLAHNGFKNDSGVLAVETSELTVDDVLNCRIKADPSVFGKGKYYMHPFILANLQTKKATDSGVYHFDPTIGAFKLGGSEIELVSVGDSTTDEDDVPVYYGDMNKALTVGYGRQPEIRILTERYADLGQIGIRLTTDIGMVTIQPTAMSKVLMVAASSS